MKKPVGSRDHIALTDDDISRSMEYFFKVKSNLVKKSNKPDLLKKRCVDKLRLLFSKSRILDGQRFQEAGDLEDLNIFGDYNQKLQTPVVDRYSPFAYAVADYVHSELYRH